MNILREKRSFRDPDGQLIEKDNRILRYIENSSAELLSTLDNSPMIRSIIKSGSFIAYNKVENTDKHVIVEHPKISFPSYPFEWCYSMLLDAAKLTIRIAYDLMLEGLGIKDCTPYNVLFEGPNPIFIDIASVEKRQKGDPYWKPQGQFMAMFLLPLLMSKEFNIGLTELLLNNPMGLSPEYCSHYGKQWKRDFLSFVYLPKWFGSLAKKQTFSPKPMANTELADFILQRRLAKNLKILSRLEPKNRHSNWSKYMSSLDHYSTPSFRDKEKFLLEVLKHTACRSVLDVGCNTGYFSKLCAQHKARVIAIDYDPIVIEKLYREAKTQKLNIQPLVMSLTNPSPATGWKNQETWSFIERASGQFDLVLMLAVIHHMLITDRIPMEEIAELVNMFSTQWALIEYVEPNDVMFKLLEKGRDLYSHLTFDYFCSCFQKYFSIHRISDPSYHTTRKLVLLKKYNA